MFKNFVYVGVVNIYFNFQSVKRGIFIKKK